MRWPCVSGMAGFLEEGTGARLWQGHPGASRCWMNLVHRLANCMDSMRLGDGTGEGRSLRQSFALDAGKSRRPGGTRPGTIPAARTIANTHEGRACDHGKNAAVHDATTDGR